jgi:hypothetical protein
MGHIPSDLRFVGGRGASHRHKKIWETLTQRLTRWAGSRFAASRLGSCLLGRFGSIGRFPDWQRRFSRREGEIFRSLPRVPRANYGALHPGLFSFAAPRLGWIWRGREWMRGLSCRVEGFLQFGGAHCRNDKGKNSGVVNAVLKRCSHPRAISRTGGPVPSRPCPGQMMAAAGTFSSCRHLRFAVARCPLRFDPHRSHFMQRVVTHVRS